MKWKMIKLLLPLLVMAFVVPMIMPGPNGHPVMTWQDWLPSTASVQHWHATLTSMWNRIAGSVEQTTGLDVAPAPTQLYKWKDANGNWHFTDRADMVDSNAARAPLPTAVNTMAPPPVIKHDATTSIWSQGSNPHALPAQTSSQSSFSLPLPATIPADKIPQLIDDAKKLQQISDDRAKQLDDL